jgi:nucleoside-diphosphate-sugar epimerase
MATNQAIAMHARDGCAVVVVRPFSVYGPGQPRDMFIAQAIDSALRNVEFKMTRGEQKRDLIFVDDVVSGLIAAASALGIDGCVINLGSGECHRLREVAELVWKLTGTNAPLLIGARTAREADLYDTWADITLARRLLEWEPRVDLEDGLRRTVDFARDELGTKTKVCQVT